ncbi:MAG: hypothetical protein GY751_16690 [Bacteroidetes bacterium]|nr:hypothetical protein [Bacteroidota bacterium]
MCKTKEWRIHIGAHKTATTHIQDTLESVCQELSYAGIEYIKHIGRFPTLKWWERHPILQRYLSKKDMHNHWIGSYNGINKTFLVSEENILGGVSDLLRSKIYPNMEKNLATILYLKGDSKMNLFMSLRSFDSILPSAYAQQARKAKAKAKAGGFDVVKKTVINKPPKWSSIIKRIINLVDADHLKIWKYEDYANNQDFFLSYLCKNKITSFPYIPPPTTTRSPSTEAIRLLEEICPRLPRKKRKEEAARICSLDNSSNSFRPFSIHEAALLRESYEEDLALIEKSYPNILINLPNQE